jgi:ribose 1,5-bisphosphate isomerase
MKKEARVNSIIKDIKKIKIQGARNIAKAALYAYSLLPTKKTKDKLIKARPTEPLLINVLNKFDKLGYKKILEHFDKAQEKINLFALKIIKNKQVIFTHCHSTSVVQALIYAKKKGRKFEVYNTETRPLYQGRKTASELRKAGIPVTQFVDAAARIALTKQQNTKKANLVFFGADAILKDSIINKIGSGMFAQIAYDNKIPVYILADSWEFTSKVKLEERNFREIWEKAPRSVKIRNLAFEKVPKKYIKAIISELGILSLPKFVKKASN